MVLRPATARVAEAITCLQLEFARAAGDAIVQTMAARLVRLRRRLRLRASVRLGLGLGLAGAARRAAAAGDGTGHEDRPER